jgi:hypothetical protein
MGMAQHGCRLRFVAEPFEPSAFEHRGEWQHLERNATAK